MTPAPAIFSPNFSHRINNFQIIRAFAASGVVVYHCDIYFADMHTEFYGVALFFVLSGYLMSALSNKAALRFALDRCWRIIPSYWLATLIAYQLFYGYSAWSGYTFSHLVQSLLFIPHAGSGGMFPLLGVGWTLNFEMYFYAIFTLSIAISHKFAPALAAAFVLLLDCILPLITDNQAVLFYYTHNYINYFVYGIIVFYATNLHTFWSALPPPIQADLHTLWKKLSKFPRVNCVCVCENSLNRIIKNTIGKNLKVFFPALLALYIYGVLDGMNPEHIVPCFFLLTAMVSRCGGDLNAPVLVFLGNVSYACYLLHSLVIEVMRRFNLFATKDVFVALAVLVFSWGIASIWHVTVEKGFYRAKEKVMPKREDIHGAF